MGTTTTYGYKKPADGDKGSTFFDDLEFDIDRIDAHSHNGTDSVKLTAAAIIGVTASITAAGWTAVTGGYKQTVSMPAGMNYDDYVISFRDSTTGEPLFLKTLKVTATSYDVYCNDNTVALKAFYVS